MAGKKKLLAAAEKLRAVRGLDEHERLLYAASLLATPEERWRRHQAYLRSVGLSRASKKAAFASKWSG